jgi:tetratricopeptide (TPR) repeat protein
MPRFKALIAIGSFAFISSLALASPPPEMAPPSTAFGGGMTMGSRLPTTIADWAKGARPYQGLGTYHRKISTRSLDAQHYFDQGMRFLWAFNHDESTRSFARALEIDPSCAMCAWGVALTVGPNYNMPMLAKARAMVAFEAANRARGLARSATPVEQALIAALAARYPNAQPLDPASVIPVLTAHAVAMRGVAARFPRDLDVQTLYAEAMMDVHAWKLWSTDGTPAEGTLEIVATLESVLARNPAHMGALHYYIHAVEASPQPEKGLAAADRLPGLAPAAGHLVHMPAHIMHRVGRYEAAAEANRRGAAADDAYLGNTKPLDYYPAMYISHNYQFLAFSAAAEGRDAETLEAVRRSRASVSDDLLKEMPGTDWYVAELYAALVRFGRWDELLAEARPSPELPGLTGGYLYATTVALAATNRPAEARARLAELEALIAGLPTDVPAGQNSLCDVLAVAQRVAVARISTADGRTEDALRELREAVRLESGLGYDEPADWFFPASHILGAELLRAGQALEAERVYRDDLMHHPGDGWALFGLAQALRAQGRASDASAAEGEFRDAWRHATIAIKVSAF